MISQATINGRSHRLMQQNSHDFAISGSATPGYAFGLVLDGCGSKYADGTPSHNEVGAKLLGQFAATWIDKQITANSKPPIADKESLAEALKHLHQACVTFLQTISQTIPWSRQTDAMRFVSTHLLTTLLGFVITPEAACLFWQGDGYLIHNDNLITLDSNNRPNYLGYCVLANRERGGDEALNAQRSTCDSFYTRFLDRTTLQWLAVATDGWQTAQLAQLSEPRSSLQLQRWLNVQSREPGKFEDDGSVVVWWEI